MTDPAVEKPIYELVSDIMDDVRAVRKESLNKQGGYQFRGIDAVMSAVGPVLRKHRVTVMPHKIKSVEYATVTVGANQTRMASVRVQMVYRWRGPLGDHLDTEVPGEAFDSGDKATAKAMSVAYRTLFLQGLTLPTDDPDPDSTSYERSGRDQSQDEIRDLSRWRGEVSAASADESQLRALWARMVAEWDNVPWSGERQTILQEAIDRFRQQPKPAQNAVSVSEPAAEGDPNVKAAAEAWDADWRAKLAKAGEAKDAKQVRALVKLAMESNARHLAKEGQDLLTAWRKESTVKPNV